MAVNRTLLGLLVAANILASCVAWTLLEDPEVGANASRQSLAAGIAFGQAGLAGMWLAWGQRHFFTRWLTVLGAALGGASLSWDWPGFEYWTIAYMVYAIQTTAICRVFALLGVRMVRDSSDSTAIEKQFRGWQFSLRDLLTYTTVISIALAMLRHVSITSDDMKSISGLCARALPATIIAIVCVLPNLRTRTSLLLVAAVCLVNWSLSPKPDFWTNRSNALDVAAVQCCWTIFSLAIVNCAGCRLVYQRRRGMRARLFGALRAFFQPHTINPSRRTIVGAEARQSVRVGD